MLSKSVLGLDCIVYSLFALYFGPLVLRGLSFELYCWSSWGLILIRPSKDTKGLANRLKGSCVWQNSIGALNLFPKKLREHQSVLFSSFWWSKKSWNIKHIYLRRYRSIQKQLCYSLHSLTEWLIQSHNTSFWSGYNCLPKWRY